jgi:hypothetical protein
MLKTLVAINDRLVVVSITVAVTIFLDDSSISIPMVVPVAKNCAVVIPVAVPVMAFANGYASADRPGPNACGCLMQMHQPIAASDAMAKVCLIPVCAARFRPEIDR